jgi:hypothetical protein
MLSGNIPIFAMLALIFAVAAHAGTANAPPRPDFSPGQEWSIKSSSPTTAKVVIGRVEAWRNKVVVHVSIIDIPIPQDAPGAGGMTSIDHVPFENTVLAASVDQLLKTDVSPAAGFEGGYERWRADAKAGIFTISVSKAIELLFEAVNERQG